MIDEIVEWLADTFSHDQLLVIYGILAFGVGVFFTLCFFKWVLVWL